jgi:hypothetical protein
MEELPDVADCHSSSMIAPLVIPVDHMFDVAAAAGAVTTLTAGACAAANVDSAAPNSVVWDAYQTDDGTPYYVNRLTRESSWALPSS